MSERDGLTERQKVRERGRESYNMRTYGKASIGTQGPMSTINIKSIADVEGMACLAVACL